MEVVKKTIKPIVIAASLTTTAIGAYFFLHRSPEGNSTTYVKKALTEREKTALIRQIKPIYDEHFLSPNTIIKISEAVRKFSAADFVNLTLENRRLRRAKKDNFELYVKICEDFLRKISDISLRAEYEVLKRLGVSRGTWDQSLEYYYSQREPKILTLRGNFAEAQAKEFPPKKALSLKEFKVALTWNTELFETECLNVPYVKQLLENPAYAGSILYYKINDILLEELGIEDEQFLVAMARYSSIIRNMEPELMQRFVQAANTLGL